MKPNLTKKELAELKLACRILNSKIVEVDGVKINAPKIKEKSFDKGLR